MKQINLFEKIIGSGFYTGYLPVAPGTFGSVVAVLIYAIPGFENAFIIVPSIVVLFFYGVYVSSKFEKIYGKDPKQCTVDEIVGTWISLVALPKSLLATITAFTIWRIMDIGKPAPIKDIENIKGGWGIMLDDVVAGFYSVFLAHIIVTLVGIYFK
jgi:phosphatidylglycerophosphatase A